MIYVFDTSSFSKLKHFYPEVFKTIWVRLDELVQSGQLISTKEVWNELSRGSPNDVVNDWLKRRKTLFLTPSSEELLFVSKILSIKHFQTIIGEKQRLKGTPVADPFVIALSKVKSGIVVTEEMYKENASRIPNVCEYFDIPCMNLERFMSNQGWAF